VLLHSELLRTSRSREKNLTGKSGRDKQGVARLAKGKGGGCKPDLIFIRSIGLTKWGPHEYLSKTRRGSGGWLGGGVKGLAVLNAFRKVGG
jgi:hypothetical protein